MNNKKHGTAFERRVVQKLAETGDVWVHFLSPDEKGMQPFDIITVKNGVACAIECKTLDVKSRYFPISRLEDNQILAFEKWLACGNLDPIICVEYGNDMKAFKYSELKEKGKVDMHAL